MHPLVATFHTGGRELLYPHSTGGVEDLPLSEEASQAKNPLLNSKKSGAPGTTRVLEQPRHRTAEGISSHEAPQQGKMKKPHQQGKQSQAVLMGKRLSPAHRTSLRFSGVSMLVVGFGETAAPQA